MHALPRTAALAALAFSASCAGVEPSVGLDLPVVSRYVFRGAVFNQDPVIQPDLYAAAEDDEQSLMVGLWSNFETSDENGFEREFTEVDPYIDYGRQVGPVWASLGLTSYYFPHTDWDPTSEGYLILSMETGPVTTSFETWYDFVEAEGLYLNLNVGYEAELSERLSLALSGGLGYMDDGQAEYYFGASQSGFSDAQALATLAYAVGEHVSFSLVGAFARVIDQGLRDSADDPDNAWVAIGTSIWF